MDPTEAESHPPRSIEPSMSTDLPESVEIVDSTSNENLNENSFQSANIISEENLKNQDKISKSDKTSTCSNRSGDILKETLNNPSQDQIEEILSNSGTETPLVEKEQAELDKISKSDKTSTCSNRSGDILKETLNDPSQDQIEEILSNSGTETPLVEKEQAELDKISKSDKTSTCSNRSGDILKETLNDPSQDQIEEILSNSGTETPLVEKEQAELDKISKSDKTSTCSSRSGDILKNNPNDPSQDKIEKILSNADTETPLVEKEQAELATEQEKNHQRDQFHDEVDTRISISPTVGIIDWSKNKFVSVPKYVNARIDIERAVNLPSRRRLKNRPFKKGPSSYVTMYIEKKGQMSCFKTRTVLNDRNPVFNAVWTGRIASEMLYLTGNELELIVVVYLKGHQRALKALIDLSIFTADMSCIDGWYPLSNGSEIKGHLKVKITPLDDISVHIEIRSKAVIVEVDQQRKVKDVHVKDDNDDTEHQLAQSLQLKIDEINQVSDQLEYYINNPSPDNYSVEFLTKIDNLNQELKNIFG